MTTGVPFHSFSKYVYVKDAVVTHLPEKRQSSRVDFCSILEINEQQPTEMPNLDTFVGIEARNLSQTGVSFYCESPPDDRWLIIRLQSPAGEPDRFLTAEVVRCEKDYNDKNKRFVVGCRFTGRLEPV